MHPDTARKLRSERFLQGLGVVVDTNLAPLALEAQPVRPAEQIAKRSVILLAMTVAALAPTDARPNYAEFLQWHGLWPDTTRGERQFLNNAFAAQPERVAASWQIESLKVMLWALGEIDAIGLPCEQARYPSLAHAVFGGRMDVFNRLQSVAAHYAWPVIRQADPRPFIARAARTRPPIEIRDAADLMMRCHWLTSEARRRGKSAPIYLDHNVAEEWHRALRWLTSPWALTWEDVVAAL